MEPLLILNVRSVGASVLQLSRPKTDLKEVTSHVFWIHAREALPRGFQLSWGCVRKCVFVGVGVGVGLGVAVCMCVWRWGGCGWVGMCWEEQRLSSELLKGQMRSTCSLAFFSCPRRLDWCTKILELTGSDKPLMLGWRATHPSCGISGCYLTGHCTRRSPCKKSRVCKVRSHNADYHSFPGLSMDN